MRGPEFLTSPRSWRARAYTSRVLANNPIRLKTYSSPLLRRCGRKGKWRRNKFRVWSFEFRVSTLTNPKPETRNFLMKRILAQVRHELTQLWADRLTVALALVL